MNSMKFIILFIIALASINAYSQTHRTVCDPDKTTSVAVLGGTTSCLGYAHVLGPSLPPGWPSTHIVSKKFNVIEVPATKLPQNWPIPGLPAENWWYEKPAPVYIEKLITESCISTNGSCESFGDKIGVTYSCTTDLPLIEIKTKIIEKGACRQELIPIKRVVANIVNYRATTPGCTVTSNGGAGGPGWSVSVQKVTCPTDTAIVVLNSVWSTGSSVNQYTCTVSAGTAGYSATGTCNSFNLNEI